ncbi:hypothetical protein JOM56_002638 [Amanita muscaria]
MNTCFLDNENLSNELAKLACAQKDIARKKQLLLKNTGEPCDSDEGDEPESQDEHDEGYGKVAGGGFTSISSQGVVHTLGGTKGLKKRHLLREDDTMSDPSEMHRPLSDLGSNGPRQTRSSPPRITQLEHMMCRLYLVRNQLAHVMVSEVINKLSNAGAVQMAQSHSLDELRVINVGAVHFGILSLVHMFSKRAVVNAVHLGLSKPTVALDYEEGIEKMLLNAMHEFACLIFTVNAFPDDEIQIQWARTVWKNVCDKADSHYELSHHMIKLITERDSWARGLLKDAARDHFKDYYKFKKGTAHETKQYNIELRATLLTDDAFHHKDPEAGTGFAENSIVADILETALFEDSSDYGVRFAKYFNPIPINLLALVFTIIEFLIDEYTTGEKVKTSFREKNNIEQFEKHSQRIEEWNKLNKQVTTNIHMKLFKKLMKRAGMTMSMREKAQQALDGRTGETDSEAE